MADTEKVHREQNVTDTSSARDKNDKVLQDRRLTNT